MNRALVVAIVLSAPAIAAAQSFRSNGQTAEADAGAKASLLPDGPWLTSALDKTESLEIIDATTARPQFLEYAEGIKLLLHIDPAALATFTLAGGTLTATEAAATSPLGPKTPGMLLRPGIRIAEMTPAAAGLTKVRFAWTWDTGSLEIRGFVPTAKLGKVYAWASTPFPAWAPDVTLAGDYELLDAPGGTAFVSSKNTDRLTAMTLEKKTKHTLVRVAQGVVGWIASNKLKVIPKAKRGGDGEEGGEEGGVAGGVMGGTVRATLAEKTAVFAAIDGPVVGQVAGWFTNTPTKVVKNWARFNLKTRFGIVEVWARPGDKTPLEVVPPPPAPTTNVPPAALELNRTGGDKVIQPDDRTKVEIARSGKDRVIGAFKLCVDVAGKVAQVKMLKPTGFPGYDEKLQTRMRTWTYRPYEVNGTAVPVCTAITFIYSQAPPAPTP